MYASSARSRGSSELSGLPLKGFLDAPVDHVAQQRHPLKLGLVLRMVSGWVLAPSGWHISQLTPMVPPSLSALRNIFFPSSMNLAVSRSAIFCSRGVSLSSLRSNRARRCAGLPLLGRGLSCPGLVSLGLRGHPLSIWMLLAPIWPSSIEAARACCSVMRASATGSRSRSCRRTAR